MGGNQDTGAEPGTIVLIHGLWMTSRSWEHWIDRYRAAGFEVLAPAWPGLEGEVESLRHDPAPLERLEIDEIIEYYQAIIHQLPSPPIIMGHSFGGAFVQVLLDRGLGAAGVAIDSASVKGIARMSSSTIKAVLPIVKNPANARKAVSLTHEQFHESFTNCLTEEESRAVYDRYYIPAAGHVVFEAGLANFAPHAATKVDFGNNNRAPLLFIVGGQDKISPPSLVLDNANHYRKSTAITDVRQYPYRCHYTLGQEGWEEVADYALSWAVQEARARRALKHA
jgi:pimeloyl-ACP methyl ester carboxylesterase